MEDADWIGHWWLGPCAVQAQRYVAHPDRPDEPPACAWFLWLPTAAPPDAPEDVWYTAVGGGVTATPEELLADVAEAVADVAAALGPAPTAA